MLSLPIMCLGLLPSLTAHAQVHKCDFHMYHYGAPTPKPLFALCNSRHVAALNQGRLQNWQEKKQCLKDQGKSKDLVIKYIDSKGKQRWKGGNNLRSSEFGT